MIERIVPPLDTHWIQRVACSANPALVAQTLVKAAREEDG